MFRNRYHYTTHFARRFATTRLDKSILIVGGGPCGIPALKELKEEGFNNIKLFEYSGDIGGQWNLHNPRSATYDGMRANSSAEMWFYSDFPYYLTDNTTHFCTVEETHNHMKKYCNNFNLLPNIQFHTHVTKVRFDNNSNKWDVNYHHSDDESIKESFDKIVLATGNFGQPKIPAIDGLVDQFTGKIYHSGDIGKIPKQKLRDIFHNKTIAIIGGGISGTDMAEHICTMVNEWNNKEFESNINANINNININRTKVYLVHNEQFSLLPFYYKNESATGKFMITRRNDKYLDNNQPKREPIYNSFVKDDLLDNYGFYLTKMTDDIKSQCNFGGSKNACLPKINICKSFVYHCIQTKILHGIFGNVVGFTNNNSMIYQPIIPNDRNFQSFKFDHDTGLKTLDNVDVIIFATGFQYDEKMFPYLEKDFINQFYNKSIEKNRKLLYLHSIIPNETYQDNIALIGPNGALSHCIFELQARFVAGLWNDRWKLPSINQQKEWIQENIIEFNPIPWLATSIPNQPFGDQLANFMSVLPNEQDFIQMDKFDVYKRIQNERMFPTFYRIKGHGKKENALDILIKQMNQPKKESIENQAKVSQLKEQDLAKAYHHCHGQSLCD